MQLIIGTRGSALALWQANFIKSSLEKLHPTLSVSLQIFKTRGDHILDRPLSEVGGKGLFTKELEDALLEGDIHLAVHSLKDMPTRLPEGLVLGAIPQRADVRDVLIFRQGEHFDQAKVIGTSSLRRACLAQRRWNQAQIQSIRGNVPTRMKKIYPEQSQENHTATHPDAVLLAMAGILRLELHEEEQYDYLPLNPENWIPAVSQGALAIECREGDQVVLDLLAPLHHHATAACVTAERNFLAAVEGDCRVPVGAWATYDEGTLRLKAFIGSVDGTEYFEYTALGEDAEILGQQVAQHVLQAGGKEVLDALRQC